MLSEPERALFALAAAAEATGAYTGTHPKRVAKTALQLGMRLGLRESDLIALYRGGLFHDVGKPSTATPDGAFMGHEVVGADLARSRLEYLRFSQKEIDAVVRLVKLHLRPVYYSSEWTDGAVRRLRPKFMTMATMTVGLVPIMLSTGTGSDVMKRIAAPLLGGILTSFLLELIVYPPLFLMWKWNSEVRQQIGK